MAPAQTILFTVIPRALSLGAGPKSVSVFVSPRLDGASTLGAFPDWVQWTTRLKDHGLELEFACGATTLVRAIAGAGLRPDLWEQLFDAGTFVRAHSTSEDYSDRTVITYPVRETLSAVKSVYQQASVTLAMPDAPRRSRTDDSPRNRDRLSQLVSGLQVHWDGRDARKMRQAVGLRFDRTQPRSHGSATLDGEGLLVGQPSAASMAATATVFSVYHHMPTPEYGPNGIEMPDRATLLDFHQALTSLNSYPELLRALGLVFDFELPAEFFAATPFTTPGTVSVRRAIPGWEWSLPPLTHPIATAYLKVHRGADELFCAAPRAIVDPSQPGLVFGLLNLSQTQFGLAQVDVDGAMHKAIMLAETLHPSGDHNRVPTARPQAAAHPEVFDPEATLPSLRSGGLSIFADNRGWQLLQSIHDAKGFNDALNGNQPRPLYAEDLVRGYRFDVWDSRTDTWHSLHQRTEKYVVGDVPFTPKNDCAEGFVELGATQAAPGATNHDRELYLHEAIARWAGWSLSAPRPGRHLSRYANAEDALPRDGEEAKFAENEPETPFRVATDFGVARGSLPLLRFGLRYRFRARPVDLAGNSLLFNDPLAASLSGAFALPVDSDGFAYLRFEPVPAPLVVIRDKAAVTEPGSAVDRLVIRTFNDNISKDEDAAVITNGDRHIIPPRAAIEMGERLSVFDDASGKLKSDAATWKLIGDRDLGELRREQIVIKGRAAPVPDDGSDHYPVEPGESIDPLPFFPDPLARGAALRDLPGTPSGAIGKAVPDAGVEARVVYNLLSDPNPRPGSATMISFDESGDWQQTRGFRFVLDDPIAGGADARPNWNPIERTLTVYLPKGRTSVVPLTSYMTPDDLKLMGVWQWLREYVNLLGANPGPAFLQPGSPVDRIAHVLQRAVEGGHWMLTPPYLLTLVHAVQQPIGRPEFTAAAVHHERDGGSVPLQTTPGRGHTDSTELAAITAWRQPNANDAYLLGALKVHGASTARIDILSVWSDPVDDLSQTKWSRVDRSAAVEDVPLPVPIDGYLDAPGAPDTAPRHVGYYDSEHDQILFVRGGDNTTWEDYGFEHAAPRHVLNDTKHHRITYTATASSRYREYFDPDLPSSDFTRTSDSVVVDVPCSARPLAPDVVYVVPTFGWERQTDSNLKRSVRFGGGLRVYLNRPWFSSGDGELLGVALWSAQNGPLNDNTRDTFKPFFTQWGMDPIWQTAPLAGVPDASDFPDADDAEHDLSLEESSARQADGRPGRVSVVGYAPQYDENRGLWFADLTINVTSETYSPFVRLALVRYQPRALADAKISRVVLADFAALTPDRSAMITADPYHPRTLRVVVSGVAPRGPAAIIRAEPMPARVSARPTRIRVRVQQRDEALDSDLAWNDVGVNVATVTAEKDGVVSGDVNLAIWQGTVQFARKPPAGAFRLLIEEHELISANYISVEQGVVQQPARLVYAEIFAIDDALIGTR